MKTCDNCGASSNIGGCGCGCSWDEQLAAARQKERERRQKLREIGEPPRMDFLNRDVNAIWADVREYLS